MGYSRYDRGREGRDPRMTGDRDERGFFERAGDEVSSWFGDDDAQRRREMDERGEGRRQWSMSDDDRDRSARYRDEGARRPYTGSGVSRPGYGERFGPERAFHEDRFDRGSSQREWMGGRDYGAPREHTGAAAGVHDPHYSEWRKRQISELDRDYDEYRRENQSRFESDFSNWRNTRQSKREMLGSIREHMQVVGSDDQPVGTVDKVRGDRIILTKADSPDGQHHSISCGMIDRVEGDRVLLEKKADEAKHAMGSELRDRALFERDENREPGAHILNRSFSGTY